MVDVAIFDLYYLLVETIFGSILLAGAGMVIVYVIMASMLKMSPLLQIFIIGMFVITFGIGYGGGLIAVAGFVGAFLYFSIGLYNAVSSKFFS